VAECVLCHEPATARGWCMKHYTRWKRHGDPLHERALSTKPNSVLAREIRSTRAGRAGARATCPVCAKSFERSRDKWTACSRACSGVLRGWNRAAVTWPPTRGKAPACSVNYFDCMGCGRLRVAAAARRTRCVECAPKHGYLVVQPRPTICQQCSVSFIGKWKRICDACTESNKRSIRRKAKASRRLLEAHRSYRRADIFERDRWRCHLCGRAVDRGHKVPHHMAATIDHLIPLSEGGPDAPHNVATAHFICNSKRGAQGIAQLRLAA
jgi:5-methylcytosine-specific restriction endonuclease McrA